MAVFFSSGFLNCFIDFPNCPDSVIELLYLCDLKLRFVSVKINFFLGSVKFHCSTADALCLIDFALFNYDVTFFLITQ